MSSPCEVTQLHGPLVVGGPGTYMIEGSTGSGKSMLLRQILLLTAPVLRFTNIISYSNTQDSTSSLDFIPEIFPERVSRWAKAKDVEEVLWVLEHRKKTMKALKRAGEDQDSWAMENPILILVDDIGGITNTTNFIKSPWYQVFTTVRHRHAYLIFLAQFSKQFGPAFINNTRCIMSFDSSSETLKKFAKQKGLELQKQEIAGLQDELRVQYTYLLWWNSWLMREAKPRYPWVGHPVDSKKQTLSFMVLDDE